MKLVYLARDETRLYISEYLVSRFFNTYSVGHSFLLQGRSAQEDLPVEFIAEIMSLAWGWWIGRNVMLEN